MTWLVITVGVAMGVLCAMAVSNMFAEQEDKWKRM